MPWRSENGEVATIEFPAEKAALRSYMMKCQSCFYENEADSQICDNCGKALMESPSADPIARRSATRGEKVFGFIVGLIVLSVGAAVLGKLTGSLWVSAIWVLFLFGSAPAILRLVSPKTKGELAGEVTKGVIQETRDLRSIVSIKDKIAQLEREGGNEQEIWKLHRQIAGMYDMAFIQSWANFDRITDGNFILLAKRKEVLIWARDHANNDKHRLWAEKNLERQRKNIGKWRTRAAEIMTNPALLQKINRNYVSIIKKHYPAFGFKPEDYLQRLNRAFPD
jgi:hypothetical protein